MIRRTLTVLALALGILTGMLAGTAPAQADASFCGSGYTRTFVNTWSNHRLDVYRASGSTLRCAVFYATNDMYGVTHLMVVAIRPHQSGTGNYATDAGGYAYWAGPVYAAGGGGGSAVDVHVSWQAPSGTVYAFDFYSVG